MAMQAVLLSLALHLLIISLTSPAPVVAIFHQKADRQLTPSSSPSAAVISNPLDPTATVYVQSNPPSRSLLARSLEPLMAAALSSMSIAPSNYHQLSNSPHHGYTPFSSGLAPYQQPYPSSVGGGGPYGAFARFSAASGAHPSSLYSTQWNVLPFSVGRYCDQLIVNEPEYQRCRADSAMNWRAAEHNADGRASIDPMRACCFFWSVLGCMEESVKRRCGDRPTLDYFRMRRNELRISLEAAPYGTCSSYVHNAFRCSLQSWIIIIAFMVLSTFILVIIISIVWVLVVRKRGKKGSSTGDRPSSSGRSFNPFRSSAHQTQVRRVSPSRSPRVPDLERPPPSPHHLQYGTRQISL
ncbi:hypothetical protein TYRP_003348 [Tyrophagus putrescentiae]|nr:hypothetical protein TYRP_003348 [Tyrophagus putrescentiae]